jgi:DNA-binding XRE family transcriptional regulator
MATNISSNTIIIKKKEKKLNMKTLTICYITKGTFQMQIHALYQKNMQRIHTSLWKQVSEAFGSLPISTKSAN